MHLVFKYRISNLSLTSDTPYTRNLDLSEFRWEIATLKVIWANNNAYKGGTYLNLRLIKYSEVYLLTASKKTAIQDFYWHE